MSTAACFAPVIAATGKTVNLAMQRLWLTGQLLPAGARLTVEHVFRSDEDQPLEIIYSFPLPRDAALRKFRITGEGFEVHSELKETEAAIKAYEEGIAQGSLATLARQHGDGVVNLTVGNIRPKETVTVYLEIVAGVELRDDGFRFRFPFTLAPAYHPRARMAVVVPGEGEMELPANEFGDVILPRFHEDASALHQVGFDLAVTSSLDMDEVGSPSHTIRVRQTGQNQSRVVLAAEKDLPNRDLVLDAHYRQVAPQVLSGKDSAGKLRFAAVIPSTSFGTNGETPRRVVILLDRSGSMGGAPIIQARKAIEACLGALSADDSFGLVAFDDRAETFQPTMQAGSRENRQKAHDYLKSVQARGGTELAQGFHKAVELLGSGGGDVLILTDGQVAGTEKILADARSRNTRLHCLGIGSASQDRFLALLARETGGVSRFVTPSERVDLPAVDLFASIGRPIAANLKTQANVQPEPPTAVFSGTPVLLFGEADGAAAVQVTWDGGQLEVPLGDGDSQTGEAVWLLQGSRLITDWESRYSSAEALQTLEKRKQSRIANRLVDLSRTYGLASREVSLVAVVKRAGDRPGQLPETHVVPVGMAADTNFGAYFAAAPIPAPPPPHFSAPSAMIPTAAAMNRPMAPPLASPAQAAPGGSGGKSRLARMVGSLVGSGSPPRARSLEKQAETASTADDLLLELASAMDSDGGMPGPDADSRAASTIIALFAFLAEGHTSSSGAFRSHVARLLNFLKSLGGLSAERQKLTAAAIAQANRGKAPKGDWVALARRSGVHWKDIEKAL